jgi:DNA replication protein DnaC
MNLADFAANYRTVTKYKDATADENNNDLDISTGQSIQNEEHNKRTELPKHQLQQNLGYIKKRRKKAVIRFPKFNIEKQTEKYYENLLRLYLPHRNDNDLTPEPFLTHEEYYRTGKLAGEEVSTIITQHQFIYEAHKFEVDTALEMLQDNPDQENAWAEIAPESEKQRQEDESQKIQDDEIELEDEDTSDLNYAPQTNSATTSEDTTENYTSMTYTTETNNQPHRAIKQMIHNLNPKQRQFFHFISWWCSQRAINPEFKPFHFFLSGGAGTGKSHLINCITHEANRQLKTSSQSPSDIKVLVLASTGPAAKNINAKTAHTGLSIPKIITLPYRSMNETNITQMRSQLENVQLVIIDEISMINQQLFTYIHGCLHQIKKIVSSQINFGNLAVLAVGDFYQLPPVIQPPLYRNINSNNNLWKHFSLWELEEIMRQKDDRQFAEMLNCLRTKPKTEPLKPHDHAMLLSTMNKPVPPDTLHIFPTRKEVHAYNHQQLIAKCKNIQRIPPMDIYKKAGSRKAIKKPKGQNNSDTLTPDLNDPNSNTLFLANHAQVMLIQNLDIPDGLVNGTRGVVTKISPLHPVTQLPPYICIRFHDENTGIATTRKQACKDNIPHHSVIIKPLPIYDQPKGVNFVRHQFPITLAWACTAHKVQGVTTDRAAISLQRIFAPGQAYVALSRVTSLQGLHLLDDKLTKIYCSTEVTEAIKNMPRADLTPAQPITTLAALNKFIIAHHNIEGLHNHITDLKHNTEILHATVICLTETWVHTTVTHDAILNIPEYIFINNPRAECYKTNHNVSHNPYAKTDNGGGVGFYIKNTIHYTVQHHTDLHLEHLIIHITNPKLTIINIYRPPKYTLNNFMPHLTMLLQRTVANNPDTPIIAVGDYNIDFLQQPQNQISDLFADHGFPQMISDATTSGQTLLDHIYQRFIPPDSVFATCHTYYSYHSITLASIPM